MIFPIGDDNIEHGHKPLFSYAFIGICILVFGYQFSLGEGANNFVQSFGSVPAEIMRGEDLAALLTSMFLHGGLMHLAGNMLYLWIFADNIEATIGNFNFLIFYIVGGLVAAMTHVLLDPTSTIPMVGASGAISAVMGTYIVMFPKSRVKMIFLLFFSVFYIPAWLFLGFWFVEQLTNGFGIMAAVGEQGGGVAWWAHIGGFVFGLIAGYIFKVIYCKKAVVA